MKYTKIKSDKQYISYSDRHEKLTFKDYDKFKDEIELIEILIDEYESRTIEFKPEMNPSEVIAYLLEENEMSKSQLARELKVSRQLIGDLLNYRRDLSKSMIIKLSKRFRRNPSIFAKEDQLKNVS